MGTGLVVGITSHVKRSEQGTSSARLRAPGSKDSLGQSTAIVAEAPDSIVTHPPHQWKNDLPNLLCGVRLSLVWQYAHCSRTW